MEGMLAAAPFDSIPTLNKEEKNEEEQEEEEDFWCELIKKANVLDIQKSELIEPINQETNPSDSKVDLVEDDDLIKDYLIEEYTKEIESYQTLLYAFVSFVFRSQKEKEVNDWREKYEADIADLNSQIDRLNEENELLTRTLCEQQEIYNTRVNSTDSYIETHKTKLEECEVETKENRSNISLFSREFEHHLILSAWNALRTDLLFFPSKRLMSNSSSSNRLLSSKSPYLLQHAHNPVNWYPWGGEAFSDAHRRNVPIFLSIGYSTCHWCHVMERESFEDTDVAKYLNDHFVSIKVDREEHPDVDHQYMMFVQATSGGGGWPLTVFLTPDRKPFLGGTYFPPQDSPQSPSFTRLLNMVNDLWTKDHNRTLLAADQGVAVLKELSDSTSRKKLNSGLEDAASALEQKLHSTFDHQFGGFGNAPKFPSPPTLLFLLLESSEAGCVMALETLKKIADGGIHDHIGGGFHRYSVDAQWHVPHFEKMLYDQGQLLDLYSRASRLVSREETWPKDTAMDIIDYVKRRLLSEKTGAFYSAEDADSLPTFDSNEKKQGAFAVWTTQELTNILPAKDAQILMDAFGVRTAGNLPSQINIHNELQGKNILRRVKNDLELSIQFSLKVSEIQDILNRCKVQLRGVDRPMPLLDNKIVTAWNAFMISGLVRAYESFGEEEHLKMALTAADYFLTDKDKLKRSYKDDGPLEAQANSIDYASLIKAFLDLHQVTLDEKWKQNAINLQDNMNQKFWDPSGGYFNSTSELLLVPMKEDYDGVEPSSNSLALSNLKRLMLLENRFASFYELQSQFMESCQHAPYGLMAVLADSVLVQLVGPSVYQVKGWLQMVLETRESEYNIVVDFLNGPELTARICKDNACGPSLKTIESLREALP